MSTTTPGDATALAAHPEGRVEKVVVVDGEEVEVKVANTDLQARLRRPKVTFRIQHRDYSRKPGSIYYAKIYLPKTHNDAQLTAIRLFGKLLEHTAFDKEGTLKDFALRPMVKTNDGRDWVWADVLPEEWWEMMNDIIEENPNVEVGVFPFDD